VSKVDMSEGWLDDRFLVGLGLSLTSLDKANEAYMNDTKTSIFIPRATIMNKFIHLIS
jgi:hypothetical protein